MSLLVIHFNLDRHGYYSYYLPGFINPATLFLGGFLAIGSGVLNFLVKKSRLKKWIKTVGIVENFRRELNGKFSIFVKYIDHNNTKRRCRLLVADENAVCLGGEILVAYNPLLPSEAFVADKKDIYTTAVVAVMLGTAFLIGSAILSKFPR